MEQHPALEDVNFWLPAEFLEPSEEDFSIDVTYKTGLSSPDTVTETESDEEEYLSELSRKLARSALEDDFWKTEHVFQNHKSAKVMAGSPQSTLCGCNHVSSRGSSNCPSPPPPFSQVESSWDVLCAAAGEVARLKLTEDVGFTHHKHHMTSQTPRTIPSSNFHFQQIQAAAQLKKQQMLLQQQQQYQQFVLQNKIIKRGNTVTGPLTAWPKLQQSQHPITGSGMRAVFLGNNNPKRECSGTGVFLPRQIGAPTEPRKKRGCSTVLLPDRVVHALNLNIEAQTRANGVARYHNDARYRNSVMMAEQRRQQAEMDLRLPQEWTY